MIRHFEVQVHTEGKGLHEVTTLIQDALPTDFTEEALLNIFIRHTSASLIIQENADPTARQDLEEFLDRLAPENQDWHRHTLEGPDDTTSHLKSAVTHTQLSIPVIKGQLGLGTWQGIYVWEHRHRPHQRQLLLSLHN